ncbi:tail fiber domain-containing protein [Xylophilus sp.]|uniref:tail fiber domain-containing protein n=1 Tax=Xylophilus sp. TaxID=2653893 RepID=UPI0013B5E7EE|nr:tail fiber domain-containing protein [Xylophilus sp.]KAF1045596.1 MAG: hypothetical protein GAK38_02888 [Xylophilus sp.]
MAMNIQRVNFDPVTGDSYTAAFRKIDLDVGEVAKAIDGDGSADSGIENRIGIAEQKLSRLGNSSTRNVGAVAGTVAAGDDPRIKVVGTTAGTVAAGDDTRITGALPKSGGYMTGGIKTALAANALLIDGPSSGGRVIGTKDAAIAPMRINSTQESGASNPAAAAFLCLYRNGYQGAYFGLSGTGNLAFGGWSFGDVEYMLHHAGVDVLPSADNARSVGNSSLRFSQLYAVSGTINTSDRDYKTDIVDTTLGLDFVRSLRPVSYKLREAEKISTREQTGTTTHLEPTYDADGQPVVDESGHPVMRAVTIPVMEEVLTPRPGRRDHQGLISQEVADALRAADIDPATSGIWSGGDPEVPGSPEGLRYEELIGPLVRAVQQLAARVDALEGGVHA